MTKRLGDIRLPYRHFERKREIFGIRGQADNVWKVQNGKPAIERLSGIALFILRGASDFYAPQPRTPKFESGDKWLGIRDWGLGASSDW